MSPDNTTPETKACPFCAETIKAAARICRFCNRELKDNSSELTAKYSLQKQDTVILETADVVVTDSRVIIQGVTYALANVTSVSMASRPINAGSHELVGCWTFIGLAIIIWGIGSVQGWPIEIRGIFSVLMLVLPATVAKWYLKNNPIRFQFFLRLGSSSGETNVLASQDGPYIEGIVDAINVAISQRG